MLAAGISYCPLITEGREALYWELWVELARRRVRRLRWRTKRCGGGSGQLEMAEACVLGRSSKLSIKSYARRRSRAMMNFLREKQREWAEALLWDGNRRRERDGVCFCSGMD
ncbi:hypothetical protein Adt_01184 [Abeliophyllum distichum]|uniref:Uncharacterized protein n=1 Tax=Abeliophyllum distichum TaxID=126358 RepID=A0ABD1VS72_9LAMI